MEVPGGVGGCTWCRCAALTSALGDTRVRHCARSSFENRTRALSAIRLLPTDELTQRGWSVRPLRSHTSPTGVDYRSEFFREDGAGANKVDPTSSCTSGYPATPSASMYAVRCLSRNSREPGVCAYGRAWRRVTWGARWEVWMRCADVHARRIMGDSCAVCTY